MLALQTLQSNEVVLRKTTKRMADEMNEVNKKNTLSAAVPLVPASVNHKPTADVPASIRNIQRLSTMDSQMTNGGRYQSVTLLGY